MKQHEPPLTRRFWKEQVPGTMCMEHRIVPQTPTNAYRQIDAVISPDGPSTEVSQLDVAGKDVVCVQTKAARLGVHLIGQAFFSRILLLRHARARSVRTVALCTADDAVLGPIARSLGIEVVVMPGRQADESPLSPDWAWCDQWASSTLSGAGVIKYLRVVDKGPDRGRRSVKAVLDLGGLTGRRSVDISGRDLVVVTTTSGRAGMYSYGEALVNRILLVQQGGARSVRSVVLCGQPDSVMDPLAAELGIEVMMMGRD